MKIKHLVVTSVIVGLTGTTLAILLKDYNGTAIQPAVVDPVAVVDPSMPSAPIDQQVNAGTTKPSNKGKDTSADPASEVDVFAERDDNPEYETFYDRYQDIVARRAGMQYDPDALYQAMQQPGAWEETTDAPTDFDLTDAEMNDGRSFINFSEMKLESLAPGDTLKITIGKDDIDFEAKISQVRSEGTGESVTWYGESNSPGSTDTITITQADGLTVGGIFTEQGLYQLEVKNGKGYIVNNATLFRHGQDQQVYVPPEFIENPPKHYVKLEAETFGVETPTHTH